MRHMWGKPASNSWRELRNILNINRPSSSLTAISEHRLEGHEFDWENVCVLDREPMFTRRLVSEMLHIQQQTKGLNRQEDTALLSGAYYSILKKVWVGFISWDTETHSLIKLRSCSFPQLFALFFVSKQSVFSCVSVMTFSRITPVTTRSFYLLTFQQGNIFPFSFFRFPWLSFLSINLLVIYFHLLDLVLSLISRFFFLTVPY